MVVTLIAVADIAKQALTAPAMSCNSQSPLAAQVRQSSGWSEMYSSITPLRSFFNRSVCVCTTISFIAGVVQEAGVPARPSISIRHIRQEPNASTMSVARVWGSRCRSPWRRA